MSFNENLRKELFYRDISYKEFAEKIDIGYSTMKGYVGQQESLPNVEVAYRMAQELEVTVEYLVTGKDQNLLLSSNILKEMLQLPTEEIYFLKDLIHKLYEINNFKKGVDYYDTNN